MSIFRLPVAVVFCLTLLGSACVQQAGSHSQTDKRRPIEQRLQELNATYQKVPEQWDEVLSKRQLDALEDAFMSMESASAHELASAANVLLFAEACTPEERGALVAFACDAKGESLRWPSVFVAIHYQQFDDAARLIVNACLPLASQNRPYRVWKWWEHIMIVRPDYYDVTRDLSLALLRHFEKANKAERDTIRDILGKSQLAEKDLPALRTLVRESYARQAREWDMMMAREDRNQPARIWIEDRHGVREMDRKTFRAFRRLRWQEEVRLQSGWGRYSTPAYPESLTRELAEQLQRAVQRTGDTSGQFEMPHGVITVRSRCTDSVRRMIADDIGEATNAMLSMYLQGAAAANPDGGGKALSDADQSELDQLLLAALRAGAAQSSRLLSGAGPLSEDVDLDDGPASAIVAAVTASMLSLQRRQSPAWFEMRDAQGLTTLLMEHGKLSFVELRRGPGLGPYRRVGVSVVGSWDLKNAVVAEPAPKSLGPPFVVELRPEAALHHYQVEVQPTDQPFVMQRKDVASLHLLCPDAKTQHALAVKLRTLTR